MESRDLQTNHHPLGPIQEPEDAISPRSGAWRAQLADIGWIAGPRSKGN